MVSPPNASTPFFLQSFCFQKHLTDDRAQQIDAAHEALEQAQDLLEKMSYDDTMEDKVEGYKRELASIESMLKFAIPQFFPLFFSPQSHTIAGRWC